MAKTQNALGKPRKSLRWTLFTPKAINHPIAGIEFKSAIQIVNTVSSKPSVNLLWVGLIVEGGLVIVALGLGWLGLFDNSQPLNEIDGTGLRSAVFWGAIWMVPMLGQLVLFHFWKPKFYRPMQEFVDNNLRPLFASSSYLELLIISVMAGLGEELLFRWCIQGGITTLAVPQLGVTGGIGTAVVIASLLFGACHWVNNIYLLMASLVGGYLGLAMVMTGNWLVPAFAHAAFDFIALLYIVSSKSAPT